MLVAGHHTTSPRNRHGFTLVELLVVMGVLVLLAAITLPTVKGMLADQKVSQAATIVQQYCEAAKARAVATGRPVAVIFNRLRYDSAGGVSPQDALVAANTCIRISTGEVFPPYTGDWAGARGTLGDSNADGYADQLAIPTSMAASLIDPSQNPPVPSGLALAGDFIQLGSRREMFMLTADPQVTGTNVVLAFSNPPLLTGRRAVVVRAGVAERQRDGGDFSHLPPSQQIVGRGNDAAPGDVHRFALFRFRADGARIQQRCDSCNGCRPESRLPADSALPIGERW
ncbi:MAG: hypothetical protein KatS3mg111_4274 [Pirellulaceae bacterium]|nr:MAG: hypothetical protein KatS3mg111_4274 [Pirellulaceae bacterium]